MPLDLHMMNASVRIIGDVPDRTKIGHHRGAIGTGFMIAVPSEYNPAWRYGYVVTAHHVLDGQTRIEVQAPDPRSLGREELLDPVEVSDWKRPLKGVDLAIAPFAASVDEGGVPVMSALAIDRHLLAEHQSPSLGGTIHYIGIFDPLDRPMARSGTLGALFQDGIEHDGDYDYQCHLADCRTYEGFSGSPCYIQYTFSKLTESDTKTWPFPPNPLVDQERPIGATMDIVLLCGMLTEHVETKKPDAAASKYGVVMILPHQYIWTALRHPELLADRREADKLIRAEDDESKPGPKKASVQPEFAPPEDEFERFEDLTQRLVNTPKPKPDGDES
jgi:trypsin-like peptidase